MCLDKSEWAPIWRTLAKLRQLKKKNRQQRRRQALLRIHLRLRNLRLQTRARLNLEPLVPRRQERRRLPLRNHRLRMRARLNLEPLVPRPHPRVLLRHQEVLLQLRPLPLRIHHRLLRLHQIQTVYLRLILQPGIIGTFIRRAA